MNSVDVLSRLKRVPAFEETLGNTRRADGAEVKCTPSRTAESEFRKTGNALTLDVEVEISSHPLCPAISDPRTSAAVNSRFSPAGTVRVTGLTTLPPLIRTPP